MGVEQYSATVIGLQVPQDKLFKREVSYSNLCSCDPRTDPSDYGYPKYCPYCGKLLRHPVVELKLISDTEDIGEPHTYLPFGERNLAMGYPAIYDNSTKVFYIGVSVSVTDGRYSAEGPESCMSGVPEFLTERIESFKQKMKSANIWNESKFGIWTLSLLY